MVCSLPGPLSVSFSGFRGLPFPQFFSLYFLWYNKKPSVI